MLKFNKKVFISLFCIVSSFVLTLVVLFTTDDKMINKEVEVLSKARPTEVTNEITIKEVSKKENENNDNNTNDKAAEVIIEDNEQEVVVEEPKPQIVYDGMTMEELASKLDRSLKNELNGKGYLYASYTLEKGVDPYLAVAISLEETGCNYNCSSLVKSCNNVGGMKGSGCGSYGAFPTLDDGIRAFIDNIYRNYVAYGLTTADTMNPKYAENPAWSTNVNNYITRIRNN